MVNDSTNSGWQASIQDFGRPLTEITFVVLDLETTGGAAHLGAAITEIGAVKVQALEKYLPNSKPL